MDHTLEGTIPEGKLARSDSKPMRYTISDRGCWECTSHKRRAGYPIINRYGKQMQMSRYVYQLFHGRVPDTLVLMHKCDNPACINPDHLTPGTQKENMHDKLAKGRGYMPWRT